MCGIHGIPPSFVSGVDVPFSFLTRNVKKDIPVEIHDPIHTLVAFAAVSYARTGSILHLQAS